MANTYTQLYFHVVVAVKGRENWIKKDWEVNLYKYISGIISANGQKLMVINGVSNHIHILIGTKPNCNLSDLLRDIKACSSKWINEQGYLRNIFKWQTGFGAFSVSPSVVESVIRYINNQKEHHKTKSFTEEYISFLKDHDICYDERYIFRED